MMIRSVATGFLLLVGLSAPAAAESTSLQCTTDGGVQFTLVFDLDAHTVTDQDGKVYPIQVTDTQVTWQVPYPVANITWTDTYYRDSATLGAVSSNGQKTGSTCVKWQKPL